MSEGLIIDSGALPTYDIGENRFLSLDTSGRLITVGTGGGGSTVVSGTDTPSDGRANPTTNVAVSAFNLYWNPVQEDWFRVACIDLNNELAPQFPDPFFGLCAYAISGGLDELTQNYSVFCQRTPSDDMVNPETDYLLPLDVVSRNVLFCPENPLGADTWLRARGDSLGNARTIASAPPLDEDEGAADRAGYAAASISRDDISSAPIKLLALDVECTPPAECFLMFFDDDAAPNNGDTPIPGMTFACPATFFSKVMGRDQLGEGGLKCDVGLVFAFSSTVPTLTLVAAPSTNVTINLSVVT